MPAYDSMDFNGKRWPWETSAPYDVEVYTPNNFFLQCKLGPIYALKAHQAGSPGSLNSLQVATPVLYRSRTVKGGAEV